MTAASGDPSRTNGSSASPSSPTGHRTASASSDRPARRGSTRSRRRPAGGAARRLFRFDRSLGTRFVAGADEAGRGCLAGPLVAAAVLFDLERIGPREIRALSGLNDSKQQLPEKRAELFPVILRTAAKVVIVSRCAPGIDSRGLHKTNLAALRDALAKVACPGSVCLSDGFPVAELEHEQMAVVGGDGKSAAIAAASVIAKETRDRYMRKVDHAHPGWEFATHVGYSTPEHREAIERLGMSPLHRRSFQSVAYLQLGLGSFDALPEDLADEVPATRAGEPPGHLAGELPDLGRSTAA